MLYNVCFTKKNIKKGSTFPLQDTCYFVLKRDIRISHILPGRNGSSGYGSFRNCRIIRNVEAGNL